MEVAPPNWGHDPITAYFDTARINAYATFVNWTQEFSLLRDIDGAFRLAVQKGPRDGQELTSILSLRSHAAYMAAILLALGGAIADIPMLLRGSLESALYGLHVDRNPAAGEVWLRRLDSSDAKQATRAEFSMARLWKTLTAVDQAKCARVQSAYEGTIEFGAHPNIGAFSSTLKLDLRPAVSQIEHSYLCADALSRTAGFVMTADIGLCDLLIWEAVYPASFKTLGLSTRLAELHSSAHHIALARFKEEGLLPEADGHPEKQV